MRPPFMELPYGSFALVKSVLLSSSKVPYSSVQCCNVELLVHIHGGLMVDPGQE